MNADEALLKFAKRYIHMSYQTIIESLEKEPMTAAELNCVLPGMTINGVKHAVAMLRKCKVIYVKEYLPHSGKPQMLLALGDYTDAPQIRGIHRDRRPTKMKPKITPVPSIPSLPANTPRLGMFGV